MGRRRRLGKGGCHNSLRTCVVLGFVAVATFNVTLFRWTLCKEPLLYMHLLCEREQRPAGAALQASTSSVDMMARATLQREEILRLQSLVREAERESERAQPRPQALPAKEVGPHAAAKPAEVQVPTVLPQTYARINGTRDNADAALLLATHENQLARLTVERSVGPEDMIIYLRIQKTGSATLWNTLLAILDGRTIWGAARSRCPPLSFCGVSCFTRSRLGARRMRL